jgi:dTMP kinase
MTGRGRFISFEGGEGAGKSTQMRLLAQRLLAAGKKITVTREPGGSQGGEEIRKLLVEGEPERWTPVAETLLFLAARVDHVARVIEPALAAGEWILCDRFADSTVVYQGAGRGLGVERVRTLQRDVGTLMPDLTFILDLDPHLGLSRTHRRGADETRFEKFDLTFHEKLREAFLRIASNDPDRCVVIDAAKPVEEVSADILLKIEARFG